MSSSNELYMESIKQEIELLQGCKMTQLHKGYSSDKKYLVQSGDDERFLLRAFNLKEYDQKQREFSILHQMERYGVKCSRPIDIGRLSTAGYMLISYIEGNDAADELPRYAESDQFKIGFDAGIELRKMHQYTAPKHVSSWYERKVIKHRRYMDQYMNCGVRVRNDDKIMAFIEQNITYMKQRPNVFQHDDFHVGNMIVMNKQLSGIIDFNRYDWGDPIHEFLKVGIFSREISIPFSIGQIRGYFQHKKQQPGELFWRLYSLYLAMCVFSSVVWTLKAAPETMDHMLDNIYTSLEDHDYFNQIKPKWYLEG
ncbi:aminoglycoside phosphotransferase family protein [Paenibacillus sp. 1001270B_150601_E10]|uniref:aminoglycoside phosphotransferase family protein n=1 Tax=Paenibacillus sp. 1001270B_150601_E10 TaxID=2787079 RepID=UPI001E3DBA7D|nr:aminoglycoside phosphotransferase family protein [Paenibacillus sp. 1001270B_150601_E10]